MTAIYSAIVTRSSARAIADAITALQARAGTGVVRGFAVTVGHSAQGDLLELGEATLRLLQAEMDPSDLGHVDADHQILTDGGRVHLAELSDGFIPEPEPDPCGDAIKSAWDAYVSSPGPWWEHEAELNAAITAATEAAYGPRPTGGDVVWAETAPTLHP